MSKCYMTVFNQQSFNNIKSYRVGSELDVESLERSFSNYGVVPIVRNNYELKQIQEEVKILSTTDFTGYQLFMCVVLTHGEEKQIVHAKDKTFHLRKVLIDPIIQNKTLNGVIKIFIVVACRGFGGFCDSRDYLCEEDGCFMSKEKENDVDFSNMLICYSTVEGHSSYRNGKIGTYYIYELCKLIDEKGIYMDFRSILVELNDKLNTLKKQVAIYESTFLKPLYLRDLLDMSISNDHIIATPPTRQKTIVMCGETGVGKSTLGNLIVKAFHPDRKPPFKVVRYSMSCPMPVNVAATVRTTEFDVNVIDTPGFGDTEGEELNAMNVCNIWKALETDNVVAVLFVFKSRFSPSTKNWYDRLLKAIPMQHQGNIFIVHTEFNGDDSDKEADFMHIRRLSENPQAKVAHVRNIYQIDEDDQNKEILRLIDMWTSLPSFTVKNLDPPEIVYEKDELGPIEHRFYEKTTVVEPRTEERQEIRKVKTGETWRGKYGKILGLKDDVYEDRVFALTDTVQREITRDVWIEYRKKYRVRYDRTRDFVHEEILRRYIKYIEE